MPEPRKVEVAGKKINKQADCLHNNSLTPNNNPHGLTAHSLPFTTTISNLHMP
jgi:hypothetical protein